MTDKLSIETGKQYYLGITNSNVNVFFRKDINDQFSLATIARWNHLIPYRTQK